MTTLMEALRAIPQEARYVRVDPGQVSANLGEGQISVAFDAGGKNTKTEPYAVDGKVVRIARALAPESVASKSGGKLQLAGSGGAYSFGSLEADLVPPVAQPEQWVPIAVEPSALRDALNYVRSAAATNGVRYYLNGVYLRLNGRLDAVASNGHVAAIAVAAIDGADASSTGIILPNKCVAEIVRLLNGVQDASVEIGKLKSGSHALRVKVGGTTYVALSVDGAYPDYESIFEAHRASDFAFFDAVALASAIDRLELTVQAKPPSLGISIGSGAANLASLGDPDKSGTESVPAARAFEGRIESAINPGYLGAAVHAASSASEIVAIGWIDPEKAFTVSPANEDGVASEWKWIAMPVRT